MPRKRRPARAYRAHQPRKWTRAEVIEEMAHPTVTNEFDMVDPRTHPLLAGFPADMHDAMIEEAEAIIWADRTALCEQHARERLKEWKPFMWDMIFLEFPHIENELTPEQKLQWEAAKIEAAERRAIAEARQKTPLAFPQGHDGEGPPDAQ